jgi:hypothetical protein
MRQKIIKKLNRHKRIVNGSMRTHIKVKGIRFPHLVHSVFWVKNGKINRIWDVSIGGYRKHRNIKVLIVPTKEENNDRKNIRSGNE